MHRNTINVNEVDTLIGTMIKGNPNAEDLINRLAYLYLKVDKVKAVRYFKKAVELFPNAPNAWDGLGEYYEKNNDFINAKKAYSKAVDLAELYSQKNLKVYRENLNRIKNEM